MIKTIISIVMPLYNKAEYILSSIRSIQAQTNQNWELIIVNDGSSDNGPELISDLCDSRIKIVHQNNQGVAQARNNGIEIASSDLIAFIDADDEWHPDYLSEILSLHAEYPTAMWFATQYEIRHPIEGTYINRLNGLPKLFTKGIFPSYFRIAANSDPPVWTSATAVKREALIKIGGFPSGIHAGEDLLTWARLAVNYDLAYSCRPLSIFHVSGINRPADSEMRVAIQLENLLKSNTEKRGLKNYIAYWYRMQARMAIYAGDRKLAFYSIINSLRYNYNDIKTYYIFSLLLYPIIISSIIDKKIRKIINKI